MTAPGQLGDRGFTLLPAARVPLALVDPKHMAAGDRWVLSHAWCRDLAAALRAALAREELLPRDAVAVQCTLFAKDEERNWLVALHQDLAVPLREQREAPGFTTWSHKDGAPFAHAPDALLARMLGARVHLDDADADNGALVVVPGSHRHGRLDGGAAAALRTRHGEVVCAARAGDVLVLRPLLLHRSGKATAPRPRRVLHFLFGPPEPAPGLAWPDPVR